MLSMLSPFTVVLLPMLLLLGAAVAPASAAATDAAAMVLLLPFPILLLMIFSLRVLFFSVLERKARTPSHTAHRTKHTVP